MKNIAYILIATIALFASCNTASNLVKNNDRDYKFEVGKQLYAEGKYSSASLLLDNVLPSFKNTKKGDEALFMLAMCNYQRKDFIEAAELFKRYYTRSYPNGMYVDEARYFAARSYYEATNSVKLDQTNTYTAIDELQSIMAYNPNSKYVPEIKELLFKLQDQLVEKEYLSAKLYYNLGEYFGNCTMGGNNYKACVITAQNAVKDYPFTTRKEEFAILILRAKYEMAVQSIESKKFDRYNDAVDEYYGFINEFPQSKYMPEAKTIFEKTQKVLNSKKYAPLIEKENS